MTSDSRTPAVDFIARSRCNRHSADFFFSRIHLRPCKLQCDRPTAAAAPTRAETAHATDHLVRHRSFGEEQTPYHDWMRSSAAALVVGLSTALAAQGNYTLARGQVGPIRIGASVDAVNAAFGRDHIKEVDLRLEGMPSPALEIRLGDSSAQQPSLVAERFPSMPDWIWRVRVFDTRFRTADGLGIGSTFGDVRARHPIQGRLGADEGHIYAHVSDLELSFELDAAQPESVTDSTRVKSVLVVLPPNEWMR